MSESESRRVQTKTAYGIKSPKADSNLVTERMSTYWLFAVGQTA